jgi:hypothetical protein
MMRGVRVARKLSTPSVGEFSPSPAMHMCSLPSMQRTQCHWLPAWVGFGALLFVFFGCAMPCRLEPGGQAVDQAPGISSDVAVTVQATPTVAATREEVLSTGTNGRGRAQETGMLSIRYWRAIQTAMAREHRRARELSVPKRRGDVVKEPCEIEWGRGREGEVLSVILHYVCGEDAEEASWYLIHLPDYRVIEEPD